MKKLILILCTPRTGSSLVSQIFWRHGCWVSDNTQTHTNKFGYTTYEDRHIRLAVRNLWKVYVDKTPEFEPMNVSTKNLNDINKVVGRVIPEGTDYWMFKTAAESYPLFMQFNPTFVFVKRDEEQTVQSMRDKNIARSLPGDTDNIRKIHQDRMQLMDSLQKEHGGEWVNVDELINGEYNSIQRAIEYCGLSYDPDLVDLSLDPKKWHYKKEE